MGSGALILALDTPFNREALGDTGLMFQSQVQLRSMLQNRIFDDASTEDLRREATQRAEQVFSLDDVASAYEMVLYRASRASRGRITATPSKWQIEGLLEHP